MSVPIVHQELKAKTLGTTEQYLEIHSPVYINGQVKVDRIDREHPNGLTIVYLPVASEKFYFVVYIDLEREQVTGFHTEAFYNVYFRATSENLTADHLKAMTSLNATDGWNKGDAKRYGKAKYPSSTILFLPNPEPDEFEDKLRKLLDFLEQDKEGVKKLVNHAKGHIQVTMDIHNANGMLGGPTLSKESISRMNTLNLEINFDLYVGGKPFNENYLYEK